MTLDFVAKRYHTLPSQVLKSGDSFDVLCATLGVQYENYLNKKARDEADGKKNVSHSYSQDQLLDMVNRVREKNNAIKVKDE